MNVLKTILNKTAIVKEKGEVVKNDADSSVKLMPNENDAVPSGSAIYRHYDAPDKKTAIQYLNEQKITVASYFIIVETPEGTFTKDITGILEK